MVGLYWIPIVDICWCICDIPHWALCDDCDLAVFFPRTRERHSQEILLAINNRCNYCRRPGRWLNITILAHLPTPPPLSLRGEAIQQINCVARALMRPVRILVFVQTALSLVFTYSDSLRGAATQSSKLCPRVCATLL